MAKFTVEQAADVIAVQQLVNDWAHELDVNSGLQIADLVSSDVVYNVGGEPKQGRAAVETFYIERLARLAATPEGVPVMRHIVSNLRVTFRDVDAVSITFSLVFFSTMGMASKLDHADPAAVADVRMDCKRGADGHWRIAMFDSGQTFRRVAA